MATCIDVAKKAHVSRATVTRVIREPDKVSKKTKEQVLKVMKELNYNANYFASALKNSRTRTAGLIIPDIVNPFYIQFAYKLQRRLLTLNYNLIIQLSNDNTQEEFNGLQFLLRCKVECILFSPIEVNPEIQGMGEYFSEKALQIFRNPYDNIGCIHIQDEVGAYLAAKELLKNGHENIVLFEGMTEHAVSERLKGCKRAFAEEGKTFPQENYVALDLENMKADDIIEVLKNRKVTACIVVAYKVQELFIGALRNLNLKLFDDLSAVFYDKTFFSENYHVTTIAHDIDDIVDKVVEMFLNREANKNQTIENISLAPYLLPGKSVKNIRQVIF